MCSSSLLQELSLLHCLYASQINFGSRVFCCTLCMLEVEKGALNMGLLWCIYVVSVVLDEFMHKSGTDLQHEQNHTFIRQFCRRKLLLLIVAFVRGFQQAFRFNKSRASSLIFFLLAKKAFFPQTQCSWQQTPIRLSDFEGLNLYGECGVLTIIARHLRLLLKNGTARLLYLSQKIRV